MVRTGAFKKAERKVSAREWEGQAVSLSESRVRMDESEEDL